MKSIYKYLSAGVICILLTCPVPVVAEIVFLEQETAVNVDSAYIYSHPSLRSLVFATPKARDMVILPPAPYILTGPSLLLGAPAPYTAYPPMTYQSGVNAKSLPSNNALTAYNMDRAHAFRQDLYKPNATSGLSPVHGYYALPISIMPYYSSARGKSEINKPARPSNRVNAIHNLEQAHRFNTDTYKKP